MVMTTANGIKALRAGHYSSNILIQITSQAVIDDKADVDLNGGSYQWPILSDHAGVLHIAQTNYNDSGTIYNGGIQRVTGLGESFSGLLNGLVGTGAGTLNLALDGSPIMIEVADIDWSDSVMEVREDLSNSGWTAALQLYQGIVTDAEVKKQGTLMLFRVDGNQYFLNEKIGDPSTVWGDGTARAPFGYCSRHPVTTDRGIADTSGDGDFYYYTTAFSADNKSYKTWRGDVVITGTDSTNEKVEAEGSVGWNGGSIPDDEVFNASKGYDTGGFIDKAGEILTAAKAAYEIDIDGSPVNALDNLTFNATSLTAYDTACGHLTGFLFDQWSDTHFDLGATDFRDVDPNTWSEAITTLVGGTGGLAAFNREGELVLGYMLNAPTGTPALKIQKDGDFSAYIVNRVAKIERVELGMPNEFPDGDGSTVTDGESQFSHSRINDLSTVSFDTSISHSTSATTLASRYLARFGTGDYKFTNCLLAKVLNVGDIVEFGTGIDDHLDTASLKGWVIGVDRGTKPWVEVRA